MRFAPLTGLFGANSSGKTSILQFLLMLKQTAQSSDRSQVVDFGDDRKSLVSLGSFSDLVHGRDATSEIAWTMHWDLPEEIQVADPVDADNALVSGRELGFRSLLKQNGKGKVYAKEVTYLFGGQSFKLEAMPDGKYELLAEGGSFRFRKAPGRPREISSPVKCYGFPDQVRASYQNAGFLSDFELALEVFLENVYYLGPLREDPQRDYRWAGGQPDGVGRRGEFAIDALLASRQRGDRVARGMGPGQSSLTLEETVAVWLQKLGLIHSFQVEEILAGTGIYRVMVQRTSDSSPVYLTDVGFGVSQILPVLVLLYYAPKGATIILEQPEIHLHPSVQAELADVFIDAIKHRGVQIIVESHSEHLLLRIQRRIAEEYRVPGQGSCFNGEDAALYFCEIVSGKSHLSPLDMDEFGAIRNWPPDFFGNQFVEVAERTRAAMRRRRLVSS